MIFRERVKELTLGNQSRTAPQLSQNDGRSSDQTADGPDPFLMACGTQIIDENRGIEDDEVTHRDSSEAANLSLPAFFFIRSLKRLRATISRRAT